MQLKGILIDMDGVLVDSEEYIFEATKLMLAEHSVTAKKEDAMHFVGMGENKYIAGIAQTNGFEVDIDRDKARTYQIYEEISKGKLFTLPCPTKFIKECFQED
jgi:cytidine deaminase